MRWEEIVVNGLIQSTTISVHFKGRVSHCFLWHIREWIWKFLEMVHTFVWLSVLLCILTKPYSLHCFKKKNMLVWRVMNRQSGWSEHRLTSVCFRAELIVSHALFPCSPHAQSEDRFGQPATTTPVTPAFVFHTLYFLRICQSLSACIFFIWGGLVLCCSRGLI